MAPDPVASSNYSTLVLVGFMGAGKTTVGRIVARLLRWRFVDVDEEIVRREGASIAEIFCDRGEPAFRVIERRLTAELSTGSHTVLAPGGGWIQQPGARESLPASALVVWLRVSPEEAVRRLAHSSIERPLLAGHDPLLRARVLLAERQPAYVRAGRAIETDGRNPEDIAREIASILRSEDHGNEER